MPNEDDFRCPVTAEEMANPWVFSNSRGWFWRVDYLGAGPFVTEAAAQENAAEIAHSALTGVW